MRAEGICLPCAKGKEGGQWTTLFLRESEESEEKICSASLVGDAASII